MFRKNTKDINDVTEVFVLLGEIRKTLSSEMASGVIGCIIDDSHIKIGREILKKHSVGTDGELYELYYCIGYLLWLKKKLRSCLFFNFNLWF